MDEAEARRRALSLYLLLLAALAFALIQLAALRYYGLAGRPRAWVEAFGPALFLLGCGLYGWARLRRLRLLLLAFAFLPALANAVLVFAMIESATAPRLDHLSLDMVGILAPNVGLYLERRGLGWALGLVVCALLAAGLWKLGRRPLEGLAARPERPLALALALILAGGGATVATLLRPAHGERAVGPLVGLSAEAAGYRGFLREELLISPDGAAPFEPPRPVEMLEAYRELPARAAGMNVLLVVGESLSAIDMGPYGGAVPMPNLERYRGRGLLFERAYTHHNFSSQAMAALTLGVYPVPALLGEERYRGHRDVPLGRLFRQAGYHTFVVWSGNPDAVGSRQIARQVDAFHSLEFLPELGPGYAQGKDHQLVEALERQLDAARGKPFLGILWTFETHIPYAPWLHHGLPEPPGAPEGDRERYRLSIALLDRHLGAMEEALGRRGLWEDTLLVLTGDHGEGFGSRSKYNRGHGMVFYELNARVPLIFANGRVFDRPLADSRLVQLKDVAATLGQLVLGGPPRLGDGISLLMRRDREHRAVLVNNTGYAWLRGPHKLQNHPFLDGGPELFDLEQDPLEEVNLYGERPRLARELEEEFRSWYRHWLRRWR